MLHHLRLNFINLYYYLKYYSKVEKKLLIIIILNLDVYKKWGFMHMHDYVYCFNHHLLINLYPQDFDFLPLLLIHLVFVLFLEYFLYRLNCIIFFIYSELSELNYFLAKPFNLSDFFLFIKLIILSFFIWN